MAFLEIEGVAMPPCVEYSWEDEDLSSESSGRSLDGQASKDVIRTVCKINISFGPMTTKEASLVLKTVRSKPILNVKAENPFDGGITTKKMYSGPRKMNLKLYHNEMGYWDGLSFSLVEV